MKKNRAFLKIKTSNYYYFFSKLFLFFTTVAVLDFMIGAVLEHFYFTQKAGSQYRMNYAVKKSNADIMIFGSSRAVYHYVPTLFEKNIGLSCYNAGSLDQHILYHYAIFESVLKRHKPRIVILDITSAEFKLSKQSYDKLSILLPLYKEFPEVRQVINLRGPYERIKFLSKTYPYNSSLLMIAGGNTKYFADRKADINGYIPLKKTYAEPITSSPYPSYLIDTVKLSFFKRFVEDCRKNDVLLYLVHSPEFFLHNNNDQSLELVRKIAEEYGVSFYDFNDDSDFTSNPSLYSDPYHLNYNGANVLSLKLIEKISDQQRLNSFRYKNF